MKIEVNLNKKFFVFFFGVALIIGGIFLVNAFGTSTPSVFGHSVGELDWSGLIDSIYLKKIKVGNTFSNSASDTVNYIQLEDSQEIFGHLGKGQQDKSFRIVSTIGNIIL